MTIARTLADFLQNRHITYSVVPHSRTYSSRETAETLPVSADQLAKAVILIDGRGYLMAVVPSNRHVTTPRLSRLLRRDLELAAEGQIAPVFRDCDIGAIPPIGPAYGMETIVDDSLVGQPVIYFEAGDHEEVIGVDGETFLSLLKKARHGQFTH
ncbi:MAG: aminoacyl-tRNA deacylase [Acidiferrobacterales bacterium]